MVTAEATRQTRVVRAFSRYRPRLLTLIVFVVVTVLIVLANLSCEPVGYGTGRIRYGWPLIWHWHTFKGWQVLITGFASLVIESWNYDPRRLAINAGLWSVMVVLPSVACEYLLRRFALRWRWSLRTMLAGVAMLAATCAWFAAARQRANLQDELIGAINGPVWLARSGPQWLDLLGLDRYRRYMVGATLSTDSQASMSSESQADGDQEVEDLLDRLDSLPTMQYLFFQNKRVTPRFVEALGNMPRLRIFSMVAFASGVGDDARVLHDCMEVVGRMYDLEFLEICGQRSLTFSSDSLAALARLRKLKTLALESVLVQPGPPAAACILESLATLSELETLSLIDIQLGDGDLVYLRRLPRLKTLILYGTNVTAVGLQQLASLKSLEQLSIDGDTASPAAVESLRMVESLKSLYLGGWNVAELDGMLTSGGDDIFLPTDTDLARMAALQGLRQARPGVVIDNSAGHLANGYYLIPPEHQFAKFPFRVWLPAAGMSWSSPDGNASVDAGAAGDDDANE